MQGPQPDVMGHTVVNSLSLRLFLPDTEALCGTRAQSLRDCLSAVFPHPRHLLSLATPVLISSS
jgi:hypothetical protein